jgi:hypothetical protein
MSDQVNDFVSATSAAAAQAPKLDPDAAKVPFVSALQLTGEQEQKMLDHAFRRLQEISSESARDLVMNPTWWANSNVPAPAVSAFQAAAQGLLPADTFLGKRTRYDAMFANDVSWRPFTMGVQNIFQQSNLVVPLSRRICRQMIARAKNHFFGTDPWLAVDPAPHPASPQAQEDDGNFANRVEDFVQFKFNEANSREDKERAIERAMILGECPVKTSYIVRDQIFDVEATVLVDIEGQPTKGADGNFITDQDQWVEQQQEMEQEPEEQGLMSRIGGAIKSGLGLQSAPVSVLKRDGQTPKPSAPVWQKMKINRRQVFFEGAKSEPIYYKDFLCPITAKDVQTADCVIHLYDKPVMAFIDLLVKRGMVQGDADARMETVQKIAAMVKEVASNNSEPKAGADQQLRPNENFMPNAPGADTAPVAEFAEFYMWFDANGDGIAENIMLIADRKTRVPIFYDHVANVTTDGLRPIEIVRINKVEGRWYGVGIMELFESYQTIVDLMVNRWNFSQSRAGRVDFWNPTDTLEGDRDPNLQLNWGATYTKKPGKKMEDILEVKYLTDVKFEQIQTMMQFFMQLAMNESGVTNANDNYVSGMEQAKLATGLVQIQQSGDEMFKPIVAELRTPLERLLKREIEVLLANMNPEEVFEVLEGDTMGLETITAEEVRDIRYKVRFLLTTTKNQQTLQTASAASQLIERFYMLPPEIQMRVASFYKKQLRALDPETNVDSVIQAGISMAPPPGTESMGAKGKDGNKSALGVTPAPPPPPQIAA